MFALKPCNFILLLIAFIGLPLIGNAQLDKPLEGIRITPLDSLITTDLDFNLKLSPIAGLSNKNVPLKINYTPIGDSFKKKSGVNMAAKSTLQKPSWDIKQKFTEDKADVSRFSKDYNLGDLRTGSRTVIIKCRDHEYVDGDRIRLMVNNVVIHPNLTLSGEFYSIDIDLKDGVNVVQFLALNEGLSRPNTAQLQVLDEAGLVIGSNRWFITTGYRANLTIIKD